MNSPQKISGFTLIELIVVITIISTLLFFSIPMFKAGIFQSNRKETGKLIQLIQSLKHRSMEENMDYFLHISMDSNAVWITDSTMDEAALQTARDEGIDFFNHLEITRIEFPGVYNGIDQGAYVIGFSKKGYSDMAIIHMDDGHDTVSLRVEPFLMEVESIMGQISFNDCI